MVLRESFLVARNKTVDSINSKVYSIEERTYLSIDRTVETSEAVKYPVKFLSSLTPPRMAPNKLTLEVGSPIVCLRNLSPLLCVTEK